MSSDRRSGTVWWLEAILQSVDMNLFGLVQRVDGPRKSIVAYLFTREIDQLCGQAEIGLFLRRNWAVASVFPESGDLELVHQYPRRAI